MNIIYNIYIHGRWGTQPGTLCPVVHCPEEMLDELMLLAEVKAGQDCLLDIGCGDGRCACLSLCVIMQTLKHKTNVYVSIRQHIFIFVYTRVGIKVVISAVLVLRKWKLLFSCCLVISSTY
jgi:hypothetical protein